MGSSAPKAPPPPDPYKTSGAQAGSNIQTGIANAYMNNPSVVGPWGSSTTQQSGTQTVQLPDGTSYQIPTFTLNQTLSPTEQGLYDQQARLRGAVNNLALDQTSRLVDHLGKPVDLSGLSVDPNSFLEQRARVEQSMRDRMAGQNARELEAERSRLTNMGFQQGTEAWKAAMDDYNRRINDQSLAIVERGLQEQQGMYGMANAAAQFEMQRRLAERNQPINEISTLMSSGQVNIPQFAGFNPAQIAGADVAGNVYNTAALQQKQYEQQMAQHNQHLAGLYGLGQAAIMGGTRAMWGGGKIA